MWKRKSSWWSWGKDKQFVLQSNRQITGAVCKLTFGSKLFMYWKTVNSRQRPPILHIFIKEGHKLINFHLLQPIYPLSSSYFNKRRISLKRKVCLLVHCITVYRNTCWVEEQMSPWLQSSGRIKRNLDFQKIDTFCNECAFYMVIFSI